MSKVRRFITAGGTLACALGIGYFMQSSSQPAQYAAAAQVTTKVLGAAEKAPAVAEKALADDFELSRMTLTSAVPIPPIPAPQPAVLPKLPQASVHLVAFDAVPWADLPKDEPAPTFVCEHSLVAKPVAAAMVELSLSAPCMRNERFTLHNNGMMFTAVTDAQGNSELTVPALAEQSVFIASFGNGEGAVATAEIDTVENYDRVVVQWKGHSGLQLHALEYGAGYNDEGHVWAGATRDVASAVLGEGGYMARYGDTDSPGALVAEVYTFPSGITSREGDVSISVEAEVTAENCGRDIEAQTLQLGGTGKLTAQNLELAMPDCNAIGDFLVLKNMINDLKIARN